MRIQAPEHNVLYAGLDLDYLEVERQARALRARVMADGLRAARQWIAARLRRAPEGRTA